MYFRQRRGRGASFPLALLAMRIFSIGLENIPPITLLFLGANLAVHLDILPTITPYFNEACLTPWNVLVSSSCSYWKETIIKVDFLWATTTLASVPFKYETYVSFFDIILPMIPAMVWSCVQFSCQNLHEYHRLFWSALFHASDMHLYYNLSSWLYKGRLLEPRIGSEMFLFTTIFCLLGSSVLYVGISWILFHYAPGLAGSYHSCAVGFSAVLFGIKVISPCILILFILMLCSFFDQI